MGYPIASLFAGGADGIDIDFTDIDKMFQGSDGVTPVASFADTVGLVLDDHDWSGKTLAQYLAAAVDLSHLSISTIGGSYTDNGDGTFTIAANSTIRFQFDASSLVNGATYRIAFDITAIGATTVSSDLCDVANSAFATIGSKSYYSSRATYDSTYRFVDIATGAGGGTTRAPKMKRITGNRGLNATGSARPTYRATGARFDASDDVLLTPYLFQSGANCIIAKLTVPASLSGTQVIAGASGASANRLFLAINTSGQLCGGVGSDSVSTILGSNDLRGQTVTVGISADGSTVKLFEETAEVYSAAQNSTPTTSIPVAIGAVNSNGSPANFSGADIKRVLVARQALTLAQFQSIRSQL